MRASTGQFWSRTPPIWRALLSLGVFSSLGGMGGAMLTGEPLVGILAYYALALLGLCSPEGGVLREAFRIVRRPVDQ